MKTPGRRMSFVSTRDRPLALIAALVVAALFVFALYAESHKSGAAQPPLGRAESAPNSYIGAPNLPAGPGPGFTGVVDPSLGRVAFVRDGNIWTKALPGGAERQLTHDGDDRSPLWSPSGEWISFRRATIQATSDDLWLVRTDGSGGPVLVSQAGRAAWSPTDDRLAYGTQNSLVVMDPARSVGSQMTLAGPLNGFAWSPDGNSIAFATADPNRVGSVSTIAAPALGALGTPVIPPPTSTLWYVASIPAEVAVVAWSGDGKCVVFSENKTFSADVAAGGLPIYAACHAQAPPIDLGYASVYTDAPLALPGGRLLAIGGSGRFAWAGGPVSVRDVTSGSTTAVGDANWATASPAWSPDGSSVAFEFMPRIGTDVSGGAPAHEALMKRRIGIADSASGFQVRQITNDAIYRDERPLWSRDGSQLLIARFDQQNNASLWLVPRASGAPREVVSNLDMAALQPIDPKSAWIGWYGNMSWERLYDYWPGPIAH